MRMQMSNTTPKIKAKRLAGTMKTNNTLNKEAPLLKNSFERKILILINLFHSTNSLF